MVQEDQEMLIYSAESQSLEINHEDEDSLMEQTRINQILGKSYGTINGGCTREKFTYTWSNLNVFGTANDTRAIWRYFLRIKRLLNNSQNIPVPRKHLLKNVSGIAHSGELLAIMGSSGAGKTTLLNALAFRSPQSVQVTNNSVRMLNGCTVTANEIQARCAYVQQEDLFIGSLTAREHLIFQAMVRLPRDMSRDERLQRVNQVIQDLSLQKCQYTTIGVTGRVKGLSGGERKRLAFASEALTDPPLMICDEPTSGLDSFMAKSVLKVLKNLSQRGKTVLITIHQPSSELFELFDKILLMANGRVAFLGTQAQAADYFSFIGAQCPPNYNPADFYIQVLAIVPGKELESRDRIKKICDTFAKSEFSEHLDRSVDEINKRRDEVTIEESKAQGYKSSWTTQFCAIVWRSTLTVLKEPLLVKVRLIQTTMVAILIGLIFFGQKLTQIGVMNINGAIFLFLTNMTFQNVFATITVFTSELPVFLREARSRLYRCDAYFLGKTIAELPLFLLVPLVFTAIAYPLIGLRAGIIHFLNALAIVTMVANVATSFGYLISCACTSTSMALSVGPPVIIPFLLFGGFFLNSGSVPTYFKWLSYLSWFRYANEGLLINQWADVQPGEIACDSLNSTCPSSGRVILETLNFLPEELPYDYIGLAILIVVFRVSAFFILKLRTCKEE